MIQLSMITFFVRMFSICIGEIFFQIKYDLYLNTFLQLSLNYGVYEGLDRGGGSGIHYSLKI